ncbi:hypothetical protein ABMA28_010365 [Loxostege sticticalis]|uniref:RNA-directed DNA polymerase n=1 Tax=Loxostege sticticalis TaxID=481309 RepID=A0ABD0SB59_LOXSC
MPKDTGSSGNKTRKRGSSSASGIEQQLQTIISRLNALEDNSRNIGAGTACSDMPPRALPAPAQPERSCTPPLPDVPSELGEPCAGLLTAPPSETTVGAAMSEFTDKLVTAITAINPVRSNQIYISNFDPSLNDFNVWCNEVDNLRNINRWDDRECLARVGNCLKGSARLWLDEWTTNDRTWTNFKRDFQSLCPRRVDSASILFNVMKTSSDNYPTYAEYARRSLLRLRIVNGLSEELISAIIIRGICDPLIRAAATNANLLPGDLVGFLSIYIKPDRTEQARARPRVVPGRSNDLYVNSRKREYPSGPRSKCFTCRNFGHKQYDCPKRLKLTDGIDKSQNSVSRPTTSTSSQSKPSPCTFCKKNGHRVEDCFAKQRSEFRGKANVNFCRETVDEYRQNDIAAAVIQGVPVDILIDSGSQVSLIADSVAKHFTCTHKSLFCTLRGIGNQEVKSNFLTTLTVEFPEISLEVDFHVVPDRYLSTPVILGTDVLNRDGVVYTRTRGVQRLTQSKSILVVESGVQEQVNTPVDGLDKERLLSIIKEFADYLVTGTATTTVTTGSMHIRLQNPTPVVYRPYKMSYQEKIRVREIIKDLLDKGIIRESESEFSSPILLVKKKDGSDRMCVDFRALNANTVKDRYPLPLIDDHIDRLGKAKFFTSLDMATGFHQIPMDSDSVHCTGFVTPEGHYEYLKMPYGLANAPVVYQRIISDTLRPFIESGRALVYVDDVLIPSQTKSEGLQTLREVLQTLSTAGFSINLKKCCFLATEVEYLGRIISNGQVRPSAHKIDALVKARIPTNVKEVRQFLGLAGYFRKYIPGYSLKTACIAGLLRKGVQFRWTEEHEQVRKDIIETLTNEPALAIYDPSLPTEVHTDASSRGFGAVLLQTNAHGQKRPVAYFSKVTQGAEPRYHSYELETLAVVKALQHFRHYLIGNKFKVITDCNALKLTQRKKDLLPRVARWWMYLQDYDFEVIYRKGTALSHADYLSRNAINMCQIPRPHNWAQIAQAADEETNSLLQKHDDGELDGQRYVKRNDVLYYKIDVAGEQPRLLCYVPKGHRLSLLRVFHDEHQHIGFEKTVDLILRYFWFPGLRQFVRKYIQHCIVCLAHKKVPRQPFQPIESWEKPSTPFDTVHTDVLGPLPDSNGHKFVVLLIDAFTKYCLLYPIFRQDANELKRVFENAISLFGTPRLIVADRGRMYESSLFTNWIKELGSEIHFITPEMHQSNGQVERYCRTVMNMIRVETNYRQESWSGILWKIQLNLNITKQKSTQFSPLNLLIGSDGATPVIRSVVRDIAIEGTSPNRESLRELARQRASQLLDENRTRQDARVNERRKAPRSFQLDDIVFVRKSSQSTGKLDSGMRGPYTVTKALPHGRYELKLVAGSYGKTTQAAAEYIMLWRG